MNSFIATKIDSPVVIQMILNTLKQVGIPVCEETLEKIKLDKDVAQYDNSYIISRTKNAKTREVSVSGGTEIGFTNNGFDIVPLQVFLELIVKIYNRKNHIIKLNDYYEASYTEGDDEIAVGCQIIPTKVVLELAYIINNQNK